MKIKRLITNHYINKQDTLASICEKMQIDVPPEYASDRFKVPKITMKAPFTEPGSAVFLFGLRETMKKRINQCLELGARYIFVSAEKFKSLGLDPVRNHVILLDDEVERFGKFYDYYRNRYKGTVIGITGSIGKTTTKQFISQVIGDVPKYVSGENYNSTNIVTTNVRYNMPNDTDYYVQEVGAAGKQTVKMSARALRPDIAIITNVRAHHLSAYHSIENIFADKIELAKNVNKGGTVIVNFDDERLAAYDYGETHVISTGIDCPQDVDFRGLNIVQNGTVLEMDVLHEGQTTHVKVNIVGESNAYNILSAFAVGRHLGIDPQTIAERIQSYQTQGLRQNLSRIGNHTVMVDCYNVCNDSIIGAVETIEKLNIEEGARKIAVIGGENKLGRAYIEPVTRQLGDALKDTTLDEVVCYGTPLKDVRSLNKYGDAATLYETLKGHGVKNLHLVTSFDELAEHIRTHTGDKDCILLKCMFHLNAAAAVDKCFGSTFCMEQHYVWDSSEKFRQDNLEGIIVLDMNEAEITGWDKEADPCTAKDSITIPDQIAGKPVFGVYHEAFAGLPAGSVDFGHTIRSIGQKAFAGCSNLTDIALPDSVLAIHDEAFARCSALQTALLGRGLRHLGKDAFAGCTALTKVCMPETNVYIEDGAIPDGVEVEYYG